MRPKIILDTNFIMSCVRQKIDFFDELLLMGFHIIIPKQVIDELIKLKCSLELKLLETYRERYQIVRFKKGYVDKGMVEFGKKHPKAVVATLDRELQDKLTNPIMIIRGKKQLEVI